MDQSPFVIPGKLLLEKVTPRNPLSGVDSSKLDIPYVTPSKKMVTLDKIESSKKMKEELVNPYAKSIHARYHNESTIEVKHKKLMDKNPNAFRKKPGEFGCFMKEVSQCDRLQSWKPSDQRKAHKDSNDLHLTNSKSLDHLPDNHFTRSLVRSASSKVSRGQQWAGGSMSGYNSPDGSRGGGSAMSVGSGMSGISTYSRGRGRSRCNTGGSGDSLSSTESDERNSPPGTVNSYATGVSRLTTGTGTTRKTRRDPHPSTQSAYLIKSVELDPYELNDDMSVTSWLSTASSLQERHEAARLKKMRAFEQTFENLRETSRRDREHTKQLIKNGEKGPPNPEDVRAAISNKVEDDIFKFEVRHPTEEMLMGYSKKNLESLGEQSKSVREEVHDELHKPVYTSEQRSMKRDFELTTRRAKAMIATGGSSSFINKELREQIKISSPDLKNMQTSVSPSNSLGSLCESAEGGDLESVTSEFKIGKSSILQETISNLYDAVTFPTIILTNVKLKTIVKHRVSAVENPSLCERTRPATSEDESFHRDQYYDIHIYGSTRGVAVLLLCWPELHHLSTEVFHSTEPEEMIHWFAPNTAATICNSKQIGKIILTKNQIKEFGVPVPPNKVIHSKYEDKALVPPPESDSDSSDSEEEEKEEDVHQVQVPLAISKSRSKDSRDTIGNWGSTSTVRSVSGDSTDDFSIANPDDSPSKVAQDAVRRMSVGPALATIGESASGTGGMFADARSGRSSSVASIDVSISPEDDEEIRINYEIKLDWLRWFMLLKHRVIVEARPAMSSLRCSLMSNGIHQVAHGLEETMSPTHNKHILKNAGMHTEEYNVILCRPKVPTHIQGYKWSLLEEISEDTSCGLGSKKKKEKERGLSKRQVALYFRDTAGTALGETAEMQAAAAGNRFDSE